MTRVWRLLATPTQVISQGERKNSKKVGPCIDRARWIEKTKFQWNMTFESQYTLNQCKDNITVCWGVGRIFAQVQRLKFIRFHFSVSAKKGCEKSMSVAVQIDARIQSSKFHLTFCWPIFVEIYIRACDKLTIFSKYARAYWRTGGYAPDQAWLSANVSPTSPVLRRKMHKGRISFRKAVWLSCYLHKRIVVTLPFSWFSSSVGVQLQYGDLVLLCCNPFEVFSSSSNLLSININIVYTIDMNGILAESWRRPYCIQWIRILQLCGSVYGYELWRSIEVSEMEEMLGPQPQDHQEEIQGAQGKQLSYSTTKTRHLIQQTFGNRIHYFPLDA